MEITLAFTVVPALILGSTAVWLRVNHLGIWRTDLDCLDEINA